MIYSLSTFYFQIINRTTQRKIINVDARNHGESPQTDEMTLPLMAKDLINLIGAMPTTDKISYLGKLFEN